MKKYLFLSLSVFLAFTSTTRAKVTLPSFFSDNMVLQQNTEVAVWGTTDRNRNVTLKASWGGGKAVAVPDADGKWSMRIKTPAAGGPWTLTFSDGEKTVLDNVLTGEVWFCSGQSNMDMPVMGYPAQPTEGGVDAIVSANPSIPIRTCTVKLDASLKPRSECRGSWQENTPEAVSKTSATAYFFARRLQQALGVPVGILVACWGGSSIEAWLDRETVEQKFKGEFDLSFLEGETLPKKWVQGQPTLLFNGMVAPLIPFTFKGIIWYQGEANRARYDQYVRLQTEYVAMMRRLFHNPEAPFYFVQIAPYPYGKPEDFLQGYFCEAQAKTLGTIPHSGMAATADIGEYGTIHPSKKPQVGDRLAFLALVNDYGFKGILPVPPVYKEMRVSDRKIVVRFDMDDRGLAPIGVDLDGFEMAGEDRVFHPAKGRIQKDRKEIAVSCDEVEHPVAVRYCFRNWSTGTVFNCFGIPVPPFRTDDWEYE